MLENSNFCDYGDDKVNSAGTVLANVGKMNIIGNKYISTLT